MAEVGGFNATLPGFWVIGALLAWRSTGAGRAGSWRRWPSRWRTSCRVRRSTSDSGNIFLVLIGGPIVGDMCGSLQRMARRGTRPSMPPRRRKNGPARARRARRHAAGARDGAAQLRLRRQSAELGRLAGEQERGLRSLIPQRDAVPARSGGRIDLAGALEAIATAPPVRFEVATPGVAVLVDERVGTGTVAAAEACLDNVLAHVGRRRRIGPGRRRARRDHGLRGRRRSRGAPGRVDEAAAEGSQRRLIDPGHIEGLGGTATVQSGELGTRWELSVPLVSQRSADSADA